MSIDLCLELKLPLIRLHTSMTVLLSFYPHRMLLSNSKECLKSKANKRTNKRVCGKPIVPEAAN